MSLGDFQRAFADLIASPALCLRVRDDPDAALAGYDLTSRERRRLGDVVWQRGMSVNCTLYRVNRITPLFTLLPMTCCLLGDDLVALSEEFWRIDQTDLQFSLEVERFGEFVTTKVKNGQCSDPYLEEVIGYELAANSVRFAPTRRQEAVVFTHDPWAVLVPLSKGRRPAADVPRIEHLVLVSTSDSGVDTDVVAITPDRTSDMDPAANGHHANT